MKQETMTALEVLQNVRRATAKLAESADGYLSMMEGAEPPEVKVGEFYKTFDGSLVYTARKLSECRCPICGGEHDHAAGPLGMFFQLSPALAELVQQKQTDADEAHKKDTANSPQFVVVILKGGHGIKNVQGEEPGDHYLVDKDGYTVLDKLDDDNKDIATKNQLGLAALSLRQKLQIKIVDN